MDIQTQEYIKDILINWVTIMKAEIVTNQLQNIGCGLQIENIVPNIEHAIYAADCKLIEKQEKLIQSQKPIGEDLPKWQ